MTKSLTHTITRRFALWKIAVVVALIIAANGSSRAQSTLRFVGPLEEVASPVVQSTEEGGAPTTTKMSTSTSTNGNEIIVIAPPKQSSSTEFRFVDASMSVAAVKSPSTDAKRDMSATQKTSSLTFSGVRDPKSSDIPKQAAESLELRFVDAAAKPEAPQPRITEAKSSHSAAPVRPQTLALGKTAFSDGLVTVPVPVTQAAEAKAVPSALDARVPSPSLVASNTNATPAPAADLSASLTKAGREVAATAPAKRSIESTKAPVVVAAKGTPTQAPQVVVTKPAAPVASPFAGSLPSRGEPIIADHPPQLNVPQLPVAIQSRPTSITSMQESPKVALAVPVKDAPAAASQVAAAATPPQVRDLTTDLSQANSAALVAARPPAANGLKMQFATVTTEQPSFPPMSANAQSAPLESDFSAQLAAMPNEIHARRQTIDMPKFSYLAADDAKSTDSLNNAAPSAPPVPSPASQSAAFYSGTEPGPEANREEAGLRPMPYGSGSTSCNSDCAYGPSQSGAPSICGVDCGNCGAPCSATWRDSQCIPWSLFGPGEYVGPARTEHVSTYYLRVNDLVTLTYITSRRKNAESYRIGIGDKLQIEWLRIASNTDVPLNRELLVQPDGTVSLPMIGEIEAAGKTIKDFQDEITKLFGKYQREPQITVTPLQVNVGLQDVINAVTSVSGSNGQSQALRVTPEGTIQAPGLGSVYVQGLTLDELRSELEARYAATFGSGLLVSPSLTERATSFVFLGGEVRNPGRYTLEGPTTVMQAVSLAGGWNNGGNLHQVVVFRRDENWCLKATKIDVRAPFYGNDPCPVNDVWLRENDLVIVPKSRILCAADVIELYFTRGVYAVFPINFVKDFSSGSTITPIP